jgi:hypothetical protein
MSQRPLRKLEPAAPSAPRRSAIPPPANDNHGRHPLLLAAAALAAVGLAIAAIHFLG